MDLLRLDDIAEAWIMGHPWTLAIMFVVVCVLCVLVICNEKAGGKG